MQPWTCVRLRGCIACSIKAGALAGLLKTYLFRRPSQPAPPALPATDITTMARTTIALLVCLAAVLHTASVCRSLTEALVSVACRQADTVASAVPHSCELALSYRLLN